jgi:hypothetical protein
MFYRNLLCSSPKSVITSIFTLRGCCFNLLREVGINKENFIRLDYERSVILSRRKSVRRGKTGPSKNTGVTNDAPDSSKRVGRTEERLGPATERLCNQITTVVQCT